MGSYEARIRLFFVCKDNNKVISKPSFLSFPQAKHVGNPSGKKKGFRTSRNDRMTISCGVSNCGHSYYLPKYYIFCLILFSFLFAFSSYSLGGDFAATNLGDYGNVTIMEVTGNYDANKPDGTVNAEPRQAIAKEFYKTHKDEYDFLVIFTNFDFEFPEADAKAFYMGVRNDVQGLGIELFDYSSLFGSSGKLHGTIDMGNILTLAADPADPGFEETLSVLAHEQMHRWGAHLKFRDANGDVSTDLLGKNHDHWSFLLNSFGSVLYGNYWQDNGNGTYTSIAAGKYYSPLDLYLMGFNDKTLVQPMLLIDNPEIDPERMSETGATITGSPRSITIDDIIAAEGERVPGTADSQKTFKTAFIFITEPGTFAGDELYGIENIRNGWVTRYSVLTDGKGIMQVAPVLKDDLPTNPGVFPPPADPRTLPPDIQEGVAWLMNNQKADGSWFDSSMTTDRDTAATVTALKKFPHAEDNSSLGVQWLNSNGPENVDYLSRKISALAAAGQDVSAAAAKLLSGQNPDGGWGSDSAYTSNPVDTSLVLKTLSDIRYPDQSVLSPAVEFLKARQNTDGGWGGEDEVSSVETTANVLSVFNHYRSNFQLETQITKAVAWMIQRQSPDGGFAHSGGSGQVSSTVYDTAIAVLILREFNTSPDVTTNGLNYLLGQQSENGSWNSSSYATALAIDAIWKSTIDPDLSVTADDVTFIPSSVNTLPSNVVINATLRNLGRTDVPQAKAALYDGPVSEGNKIGEQVVSFPGLSSVNVTFSVFVRDGNEHRFSVSADPENLVNEPNESDNTAMKILFPQTTYDFEILPSDISISVNPADIFQDLKITSGISNRGTMNAYNVQVKYSVEDSQGSFDIGTATIDIPAGETVRNEIIWRADRAGENLPLTVSVDPLNAYPETSEENNRAVSSLTVNGSTEPNLSISYEDISISADPAKQGGDTNISARIKNEGFSTASEIQVNFYRGIPGAEGLLIGGRIVPSLNAGESTSVSTDWTDIAESGEKIIYVKIDPDNRIKEIREDDNDAFTTLKILSLPDLAVSTNSIEFTPPAPKEGDMVSVRVLVQNRGEQDAADVTLKAYEGNTLIGTQTVSVLPGNSQASTSFTYETAGKTGAHKITVDADPDHVISEQSEENNQASRTFGVQDANLWLTEQYISPDGDGVKDSTEFFFRLDAPQTVRIAVVNGKGETVRTFAGSEFENTVSGNITWDGLDEEDMVVDDGQYQIKLIDLNNSILGSLLVVVDNNRSPLTDAIGTKYLLNTNLTCMLPDIDDWQWFPDEGGIFFNIRYFNQSAPEYQKGLYTISPDGQDIFRVSPAGENVYSYALSPDGERFVFTVGNKLWMANIDGSNTQLLDEVNAAYSIFDAQWSPDSGHIVYSLGPVYISGNKAYELWIINTSSLEKNRIDWGYLTLDLTVEWSPDSREVAYFVIPPDGSCIDELKVYNVSGEKRTVATFYDYCEWYTPIYWFDKGKILPLHPSLGSELWLYDSSGNGEKTELSGGSYVEDGILPAPDHKSIAFITSTGRKQQLNIADSGGNVSVLHVLETASTSCSPDLYDIVWTPDGSKMAFLEKMGTAGGSQYPCAEIFPPRIVVLDLETNTEYVMPADSLTLVRWLSDNHSIIGYRYDKNYHREICAANTEGKSITTIASDLYLPYPEEKMISPLERQIAFYKNTEQAGICYGRGSQDLWAVSSAMNLTADLSAVKEKASVVLKGTAADLHFEGYVLEYADTNTPDTWQLVSPPSDMPVMNDIFTAWVPPYEGSFYVKLTVRDKAGNAAMKRKRISWGISSSISNIYKSREIFSPNNDGVADVVELHYKVLEPVHLEFTVYDSNKNGIKTIDRDYTASADDYVTWDGRDSSGNIVSDGKYTIKVFDFEFFVEVDNTPPDAGVHLTELMQDYDITTNNGTGQIYTELSGHAVDANLKNWVIEYGEGDNPSEWHAYISGEDQLAATDENGDPVLNPVQDEEIADYRESGIELLVGRKLRITAEDFAGNRSSQVTGFLEERLILSNDLWQDAIGAGRYEIFILAKPDELYPDLAVPSVHRLGGLETIRLPLMNMDVQYYNNRQWSDIPLTVSPASGLIDLAWDNSNGSQEMNAIRIKATDITGHEHYSNEVLTRSLFSIDPCNLTAFNSLFEELNILKFQVRSGQDSRYAQWTDFLVFDPAIGQSIPTGTFSISGTLPDLQDGLPYKIRMAGTGRSGKYYENIVDYPAADCQDQEPPQVPLRLELEVDYSEADCGLTADGMANLRAYLGGYQDDIALKTLSYYLRKPEGDQLVQRYNLSGGTLSDTVIDTNSLSEGSYPVKAVLSYFDNRKNETMELTAASTLIVDRLLPASRITYPDRSSLICPVRIPEPDGDWQGIAVEGAATDNNRVKRYEMYYGSGENPVNWLPAMTRKYDAAKKAMVDSPILVDGPKQGTLGIWKVSGLQESAVSIKLKVIDAAGNVSCSTTDFSIDNVMEISNLARDKNLFSPNGDGILDDVTIHYQIDDYATVDIKVFRLRKDINGLYIPDATPARTIATGLQHTGGTASAAWDGKDDAGMTVPDGWYALAVSSEDPCGNTTMKWTDTEVDNSPPAAIIAYPGPTDMLGNVIEVKGTADDINFEHYVLEAGTGSEPAEWTAITSDINPLKDNILGLWNAAGLDGIRTIRLTSFDRAGNQSMAAVTVDLGQRKNLIQDLHAAPRIFSPNNDGKIDTAEIHYSLTDSCQVMIAVTDETGVVRKTYSTSAPSAGAYAFVWDGSDNSGAIVPDGSYAIRLSAALSSNPSVTQDEAVTVIADSVLPTIDIRQPLSNSFVGGDVTVAGSIIDQNLLEYTISCLGDAGTVLTDQGNQSRENYMRVLNGLPEGSYLLNIIAKDRGENVTEEHIVFTVDKTPPKVALDLPAEGEIYGSGKNTISVNGSITETNLELFRLQYGAGDYPSQWTTLLNGITTPAGPQLFSWNVGKSDGIADGLFTLSLFAKDKAGLTAETKVRITIDNTSPDVAITAPPNGGYVRTPVDIKGTAADANLEKYTLELSEGLCSTAFKWGSIKSATTSVKEGTILSWQILPSDGDYCLRLTATDKPGNTAVIRSDLKVDTHPPSKPLLSGTIENGPNTNLTWTANSEPDISGYDLYRNGQKINIVLLRTAAYQDQNMKEGIYIYTVKAIDFAGNESDFSNEVRLRIDVTGPDAKIRSPLNGTSIRGIVEIKGTAYSSDDFRQYRISIAQGQNPASWDIIRTSPVPVSYGILAQWDTLGLQGPYSIKLEAEDITGNITTHQITFTVDDTPPAPPVLISAIPNNSDAAITWQTNTEPDLAGYLLYRNSRIANVSGMVTGNLRPYLISGTTYTDKALPDGTFRYSLIAMDQAGNMSGQSNTVEVNFDTRPPHVTIIEPANASSFDSTLRIRAESADTDITSVQFQYKKSQDSVWINLDNPVTQMPYTATLEPSSGGLTYGTYHLRAVATDSGGKTDPVPSFITVTYSDITAPSAPYDLRALTNGKEVTLTWTANAEADLNGYNIYRTSGASKAKINSTITQDTIYHDSNLADGVYTYEVTAVDTLGNESKASNSTSAKVYMPLIAQPYTPTSETIIPVNGGNADANSSVEMYVGTLAGPRLQRTVSADVSGNFEGNIELAPGENRIVVKARDSEGNISRTSDSVVVVYNEFPSIPIGLVALSQDSIVGLTWNPNPESDLSGYNLFRNNEKVNIPTDITAGTTSASSNDYDSLSGYAFDGDPTTYWMSKYRYGTFTPEWWEIDLPYPELISHIEIHWESESYAGKDYEVQVWSGYAWITQTQVTGNAGVVNSFDFDPSYRTDKIRIYITDSTNTDSYRQVGISEIKILKDNLIAQPLYQDAYLHDGKYSYKVTAVDYYGFEGLPSEETIATVGDVTPPAAPINLTAAASGPDVTLNWLPNTEPDIAGYNVFRSSAQGWMKINSSLIPGPVFTDTSLPNGTYAYRVTAVDIVGNESLPSNEAIVQVSIALPDPPFDLQVNPLPEGKALGIAWEYSGSNPSGFNLYRSLASGGPYEKMNDSLLNANAYTDTGLTNGSAYYYIVTAVDSIGNEGPHSNEAMGVPADSTEPARPRIFYPTIPAVPVISYNETTDVSGTAEPASIVQLFRDGISEGKTTALEQDTLRSFPLESGIYTAALSPDGMTLAYVYKSALWLKDLETDETGLIMEKGTSPRWAPDGKKIAYIFNDTNNYSRIGIYDIDTGTAGPLTDSANISENGLSWSSDGTLVAFRSNRGGSWNAWIKDLETGSLMQATNGISLSDVRLSPDGKKLACFKSQELSVLDLRNNVTEQVDAKTDGYSLDWSPDSRRIVFISKRTGNANLFVFDTDTKEQLQVTDFTGYMFGPVWSPDGKFLAFGRSGSNGYSVWLMDARETGTGRILKQDLSYMSYLAWIRSGAIAFLEPAIFRIAYTAGYFNFRDIYMDPGENIFSAVSADFSGNTSGSSEEISVIYDTSMMPDLEITEDDIFMNPPYPRPGEETSIHIVVRNRGAVEVEDVQAEIYLVDSSGNTELLKSQSLPALGAGAEEILWFNLTGKNNPERYTIIAVIDSEDKIPELLETNNLAMKGFFVAAEEGIQMTTTLDSDTYQAGHYVGIRISLVNSGIAKDVTVLTSIEDEKGNSVSTLNPVNIQLPYAFEQNLDLYWNTGMTYAGPYRVHTQLQDASGLLDEKTVPFIIQPDVSIESQTVTDRMEYGINEDVRVSTIVRNKGKNYIIPELKVKIQITDAANNTLFSGEESITNLMPGISASLHNTWNSGLHPAGEYHIVAEIYSDGDLVSSQSTSFRIRTSSIITGNITVTPAVVSAGNTAGAEYSIQNTGNTDISGLIVRLLVIDPQTLSIMNSHEESIDMAMNAAAKREFVFVTQGYAFKTYEILLQYLYQGNTGTIATAFFTVRDGTPPITSDTTTDRTKYNIHETVHILSHIRNTSSNVVSNNLTAKVSIVSSGDQTIFTEEKPVQSLTPGQSLELSTFWNTSVHPKGLYTAELVIIEDAKIVNKSTATFEILGTSETGEGLSGIISAGTDPVFQGKDEMLNYAVTNNGNEDISALSVKVSIVDSAKQEEVTEFSTQFQIKRGETVTEVHAVSTMQFTPGSYSVVLQVATGLMTVPEILGSTTFEVKPALGIIKNIAGVKNLLVWVNEKCRKNKGINTQCIDHEALCVREDLLAGILQETADSYHLVYDKKEFGTEQRNPLYTHTIILGDDQPLEERFFDEIREQVYSGNGILSSLSLKPREWCHAHDDSLFGIRLKGSLPGDEHIVQLDDSPVSEESILHSRGKAVKVEADNSTTVAGWMNAEKGCHKKYKQEQYPALILNEYGTGKAVYSAFDLGLTLNEDTYDQLSTILKKSLLYLQKPADTAGFYPNQLVPVEIKLKSAGGDFDIKLAESYPPDIKIYDPSNRQWITDNPWIVTTHLEPDGTKDMLYYVLMPDRPGTYFLETEVGYISSGSYYPYQNFRMDLVVERDEAMMVADILASLKGLAGVSYAEKMKIRDALRHIGHVQERGTGGYENIEKNISDLLGAVDSLFSVTSADVSAIRLTIDRVLRSLQSRYYIDTFMPFPGK